MLMPGLLTILYINILYLFVCNCLHVSVLCHGHLKTAQSLLGKGAHYGIENTQGKMLLAKFGSHVDNLLSCINQCFQADWDMKKDVVTSLLG
jgi:hypothetical protein